MSHREIILIGERDPGKRAHAGIEASLGLFQREADPTLTFRWVSTAEVAATPAARNLASATGIWCAPGSPYASAAGALQAVRFAREEGRAFLGTCGGFQHALMEFSQNVLGRAAAHEEIESTAADPLIVKLSCSLVGATARVSAVPGTRLAEWLGGAGSVEAFHCNYGLAPAFEPLFDDSDLKFVAHDAAGQVRAFQLDRHPFFVGTLFQPERRALSGSLHPLVSAFLSCAVS